MPLAAHLMVWGMHPGTQAFLGLDLDLGPALVLALVRALAGQRRATVLLLARGIFRPHLEVQGPAMHLVMGTGLCPCQCQCLDSGTGMQVTRLHLDMAPRAQTLVTAMALAMAVDMGTAMGMVME